MQYTCGSSTGLFTGAMYHPVLLEKRGTDNGGTRRPPGSPLSNDPVVVPAQVSALHDIRPGSVIRSYPSVTVSKKMYAQL